METCLGKNSAKSPTLCGWNEGDGNSAGGGLNNLQFAINQNTRDICVIFRPAVLPVRVLGSERPCLHVEDTKLELMDGRSEWPWGREAASDFDLIAVVARLRECVDPR